MNLHTKESIIAFESGIRDLWEAGELRCLLHLCGGNEAELINIFQHVRTGDWVFSTHRNHYHALLAGIPADRLRARIMEGGSMFVYNNTQLGAWRPDRDKECYFLCSAVLAGTCGIAVGVAHAIKNSKLEMQNADGGNAPLVLPPGDGSYHASPVPVVPHSPHVWCFVGDGAEEEGHFYEAVMFARGHKLPITFIVEDNDRQVDTDVETRRGTNDCLLPFETVGTNPRSRLLVRYEYTPTYPHAGSGCKQHIQFKR